MDFVLSRRDNMGCMWFYFGSDNILTAAYGVGMFGYNMICLMIGLIIIYYVIRNIKWNTQDTL